MKLTATTDSVIGTTPVILAFDVSMDTLNLYTELNAESLELDFENRTDVIERNLIDLAARARRSFYERVLVVAESTGGYQESLMRAARRLGLEVAWVSGEAVAKMRVVESNDSGKTDIKDPRVIHLVAWLGKTLEYRELDEQYGALREWHKVYEAAQGGIVQAKGAIHNQLNALFPDFSFSKGFLYGPSGRALVKRYGASPYRIVAAGKERFAKGIKKAAPRIQRRSIERLWNDASTSVANRLDGSQTHIRELRLQQLWEDLLLNERRKLEAAVEMEAIYEELCLDDRKLPTAVDGVVTTLTLARIVAETGPLSDFTSTRKIMRFAGLNLRERQSGKYRGKTKLSKKGRRGLRNVLDQAVLPLVKRSGLYGEYYHGKKERDNMPGTKAMVAVARLFLKMIFGWYKSGQAFDHSRVFTCEAGYARAA
jgi:transposase